MNEKQLDYIAGFYGLFENARDNCGWTEEECSDAIVERAKAMRSNMDSRSDRFTKKEWLQIFDYMITFEDLRSSSEDGI